MEEKANVTSNECSVLLAAIQASHADIERVLAAGLASVRAEINAGATVTNAHLKQLNGKVAEHERIIGERQLVIDDFNNFKKDYAVSRKKWDWVKKNWLVISIGFLVLVGIVVGVYDAIGLRGLMSIVMK